MSTIVKKEEQKSGIEIDRVDDLALLISMQKKIRLGELIDEVIPRHGNHQGLSTGQLVEGWISFILTEGDHRKVYVRDWIRENKNIMEDLLSCPITDTDFTDDRLGQVLTKLSDDSWWYEIESGMWKNSVYVFKFKPEVVRLDASTASGYHDLEQDSLFQNGYTLKRPYQPQVKFMAGTVDIGTNGHLVAMDVSSGNRADDVLYKPVLKRLRQSISVGLGHLYIGDSKLSSISNRFDIVSHGDYYLTPLARTGHIPEILEKCVKAVVEGEECGRLIYSDEEEAASIMAMGYETSRLQGYCENFLDNYRDNIKSVLLSAYTGLEGLVMRSINDESIEKFLLPGYLTWKERLLVIRSPGAATKALGWLNKKIKKSVEKILSLTPEPGRGKKQIRDEDKLHQEVNDILEEFDVAEYVSYTYRREEEAQTHYIGRGRGGKNRPAKTTKKVRYVITGVEVNKEAINKAFWYMGWRLYATNKNSGDFPMNDAIKLYRSAPRIERNFHLFKSAPVGIEPLYVKRDDQIKGLVRLLSLCVRLLTLIEIVSRRNLKRKQEKLVGLYEGNRKKETDKPTAKKLLKAFRRIDRVTMTVEGKTIRHITPLSPLQKKILSILELEDTLYEVPFENLE